MPTATAASVAYLLVLVLLPAVVRRLSRRPPAASGHGWPAASDVPPAGGVSLRSCCPWPGAARRPRQGSRNKRNPDRGGASSSTAAPGGVQH